jgi:hypothetical protein
MVRINAAQVILKPLILDDAIPGFIIAGPIR